MKKLLAFVLVFTAASFTLHAELVWKTGYIILNSGDSVRGDIKVNTKKELSLFQKISLKQGDAIKNYKPGQVKEYGFESTRFLAKKVDGEMQFLKVLSAGRINLYEFQFEMQHGSDIVVEKEYYIEKNDGTGELQKAKSGKFKKTVAELMADNATLVARVQSDNKKYEIADMQSVVDEYNEWYATQNSAQGSR
jgi:hypothetical protein